MFKYKVCFWMNTKSNHQNAFFEELYKNEQIDLQVRYISKPSQNRIDIGWDNSKLENYEKYVSTYHESIESIQDYKERIHIILGNKITFSKQLLDLFIKEELKWIHWSERYGLVLAHKLKFNVPLFKLIRPMYLLSKYSYGKLVNNHAIGAFCHGELAKKDFKFIGIKENKISDLFYTSVIKSTNQSKNDILVDKIRFLYIGELSKRKGIEDLLNACSNLKSNNWKLTIVGKDKSNGYYSSLCSKLKLDKKIKFEGVIPHNEIAKYYISSDVFVFPSRFDGWGAVLNEAVSYSLPIISTDETSASFSLVKNNGFIVKASNSKDILDAMQQYLDNPSLIKKHSINSEELKSICTPKANVIRFMKSLDKWLGNKID